MALQNYLDLSTKHVSEATMQAIDDGECPGWPAMTVASYAYGAFLSVPNFADADCITLAQQAALPQDLRTVLLYAFHKGAFVVRLDADGDEIDGLQTFDW